MDGWHGVAWMAGMDGMALTSMEGFAGRQMGTWLGWPGWLGWHGWLGMDGLPGMR